MAQEVELLFHTSEVLGSYPVIGKFYLTILISTVTNLSILGSGVAELVEWSLPTPES